MTRFMRRIAALTAIAALAFAQLAASAYACPLEAPRAAPMTMADGSPGCDEAVNANLCERHCDSGSLSVAFTALSVPALPASQPTWRIAGEGMASPAAEALERQFLHSHPPPSLILFGVLRI